MPSTLPLSVTGPDAGGPPSGQRRRILALVLGLAAALPPPGFAAPPASSAQPSPSPDPAVSPARPRPQPAAGAGQVPTPAASSTTAPAGTIEPAAAPSFDEATFQALLREANLDRLEPLCRQLVAQGDLVRLRQMRQRLITLHPAPQPLVVLLANAEVLLSCRMPEAALGVLDRISPARGAERVQWLTLQWRAANAALDHRRAALALQRLAGAQPSRLESLQLPLARREDGRTVSRSALELLADHLEAEGRGEAAAQLLLQVSLQDTAAVGRLGRALRLLASLPPQQREPLFERALEQAAAVGAWGVVSDLLDLQASLPATPEAAARNAERRQRLSRRLDDAYSEWKALEGDPAAAQRRRSLEQRLRSPQASDGHAADLPPLPAPAPAAPLAPPAPAVPPGSSPAPLP